VIIAQVAGVILVSSVGRSAQVVVTPVEVIPGGIARVVVSGACEGAEGSVGGQALRFFRTGDEGHMVALSGIDVDAPEGAREVEVRCNGWQERASFRVRAHEFPRQELTVPDRYVRPSPAEGARAAEEARRLSRLWATTSPERLWHGKFQRPAEGPLGAQFGLQRILNGEPRSPHSGIDISASHGTPVVAANRGRVALRDGLFFSGNTIVLDHGLGLYTAYLHLSEFRAFEGEVVAKGQTIGLVGATGRATGPHLHFGARLGGARVEPWQLITADLDIAAASRYGADGGPEGATGANAGENERTEESSVRGE